MTWRKWFIAWYTLVAALGIATLFAGAFISGNVYRLLSAIPVGTGITLACAQIGHHLAELRFAKLRAYLPAQIEWLNDDDEGRHVAVTRGNGEQMIVTVPVGYHPSHDAGLALIEQVCPNMSKSMHRQWKNAAVEIGLKRLLEDSE